MRYLIIYMSHHGTTQKIAGQLADELGRDQTTLVNLQNENPPSLESFDTIIIGGSIHGGQVQGKIREFCKDHFDTLMSKKLGLFICSMAPGKDEEELGLAYHEQLRKHATALGMFGGELLIDKMNLAEKVIVRLISNQKTNVSAIKTEAIKTFRAKIAS